MHINVGSVIFAIISIIMAKIFTEFSIPYLNDLFDLTQKQEHWLFLLMVWATGHYGYALKLYASEIVNEKNEDKE